MVTNSFWVLVLLLAGGSLIAYSRLVRMGVKIVLPVAGLVLTLGLGILEGGFLGWAPIALFAALIINRIALYSLHKQKIRAVRYTLCAGMLLAVALLIAALATQYYGDRFGFIDALLLQIIPLLGLVLPLGLTYAALYRLGQNNLTAVRATLIVSNWLTGILIVPVLLVHGFIIAVTSTMPH